MDLIFCTKNTALPALRSAGKSRVCVQIHLRNVICTYLQHFSFAETETAKEQGGILCTLLPRDNIPFHLTIRFPVTESTAMRLCGVVSFTGSSSLIPSRFPDSQLNARSSFSRRIGYAMVSRNSLPVYSGRTVQASHLIPSSDLSLHLIWQFIHYTSKL